MPPERPRRRRHAHGPALPPETAESLLARLETFGIRLGLGRIRRLLAELGDPQARLAPVLVAGTNGKGSTAALVAAIAEAAGIRSGLYTSPHLESPIERIRVGGRAIDEEELTRLLEEVLAAGARVAAEPPTHFEALTAAALVYFERRGVELALLEVGLGGRLDATNAVEPVLSLIADVALDHEAVLGGDVALIAAEKAGILRAGTPAVVAASSPEAHAVIAGVAAELGCPIHRVSSETATQARGGFSWDGRQVRLTTPERGYDLWLPFLGDHQLTNLALAVRGVESLAAAGWGRFDARAIVRGVASCRWPGRLERVVLPSGRAVLLDGAHNAAGAAALAVFLERRGSYSLLFGALEDKDVAAMLPPLARGADQVFLTTPPESRGLAPDQLLGLVGGRPVFCGEPAAALERALDSGSPMTVVCGSIYLAGWARGRLRELFGVPAPAAAPLFAAAQSR